MSHTTASLAEVVRDALNVAGHLTPKGDLTRTAADLLPAYVSRATVSRHLVTGDFTTPELHSVATILLNTTASALMAQAEQRAA